MSYKNLIKASIFSLLLSCFTILSGCGSDSSADSQAVQITSDVATTIDTIQENETPSEQPPEESENDSPNGARDNTSIVLVPVASGSATFGNDQVTVDYSNASEGYIIVNYKGSNDKPKLQINGPQGVTYNFDIKPGNETYCLTQGSGNYQVGVYEHVGNSKYVQLAGGAVDAVIENEFSPYLYPSQYVYFDADSKVVELGEELAAPADNDLDVVSNVYNFVISNISYDTDLAQNVTSTYLPLPDKTLEIKTGICFDYAALMAALLRSQRIPTRLEVGYSGDAYHAWISTYIEDIGWVNGIVEFHGNTWELMDPTLASTTSERELRSYIGDGSKYIVCFEY